MKCVVFLFLIFFSPIFTHGDRTEEAQVALELLQMDLEDRCDELAKAQELTIFRQLNSRKDKIEVEKSVGAFTREESNRLKEALYNVYDLQLGALERRQLKLFTNMGDVKLPPESWNKLVTFRNANERLTEELSVPCYNNTGKKCTLPKSDVSHKLATSTDPKELKTLWSAAQEVYTPNGKQFPQILKLVNKAAKENGVDKAESYWEMLVEFPDAYDTAKNLWEEIEPLYIKLHEFVKVRLQQYYGSEVFSNSTGIPVYLLGSEFGTDWSNIAPLVLPHRYLYDEITSMLDFDNVGGRKAYKIAEQLATDMGLGEPEEEFWTKSVFNNKCPSRLLTYCSQKYSAVITCNSTGWTEYLDAHEDMVRAKLSSVDYPAKIQSAFRISALDEALANMGTFLAVKNLPLAGIVPEELFVEGEHPHQPQMTALLLLALRTLPRLPYYLLADTWRLQYFAQKSNASAATPETWWSLRNSIQKVTGVTNQEWDFLGDPYISSNTPYIGKFMGTILQFQLVHHFEETNSDGLNILQIIAKDEDFKNMLRDRPLKDWPDALMENLYYEISSEYLVDYFKPLELYMSSAPLQQVTQTVRPKTTTTTTSTPKSTTAPPEPPRPVADAPDIPKAPSDSKHAGAQPEAPKPPPKLLDYFTRAPKVEKAAEVKPSEKNPVHEGPSHSSVVATWVGALVGVGALLVILVVIGRNRLRNCGRKKGAVQNRRHEV